MTVDTVQTTTNPTSQTCTQTMWPLFWRACGIQHHCNTAAWYAWEVFLRGIKIKAFVSSRLSFEGVLASSTCCGCGACRRQCDWRGLCQPWPGSTPLSQGDAASPPCSHSASAARPAPALCMHISEKKVFLLSANANELVFCACPSLCFTTHQITSTAPQDILAVQTGGNRDQMTHLPVRARATLLLW